MPKLNLPFYGIDVNDSILNRPYKDGRMYEYPNDTIERARSRVEELSKSWYTHSAAYWLGVLHRLMLGEEGTK